MLPPIWVAAWASQRSRNGRLAKTAVMLVPEPGVSAIGAEVIEASTGPAGGSDGGGDGWIAPLLEAGEPTLERPALDEHVTVAGPTTKADVGAEAVDEPQVSAARVPPPEPDYVAEEQLEHGSVGHAARA